MSTLLPMLEQGRGLVERRRIERALRSGDWVAAEALWRAEEEQVRWRVVLRALRIGLSRHWSAALRTAQRTTGFDDELVDLVQGVANHAVLRARMDLALGLPDEAVASIRAASSTLAELGLRRPRTEARVVLLEADLALAHGDEVGAIGALGPLLGDDDPTGLPADVRPEALLRRGLAHVAAGDDERARADFTAALEAPGASAEVRWTARLRRAERALTRRELALARADLDAVRPDLARMARLDRGHALALESRWRALVGERTTEEHLRELAAACDELFAEWRARPLRPNGFGLLRYARTSQILGALAAEYVGANDLEGALSIALRAHGVGTLARTRGAPAAGLADVRRALLRPGAGVLVLLPAPDASFSFLLVGERILVHRGPEQGELLAHARVHQQALWDLPPDGSPARAQARMQTLQAEATWLRDALLGEELASQIAALDTLAIVGRDLVDGVELEALDIEGEPLGRRATYDVPSLPLAVASVRAPSTAGRTAVRVVVDTGALPSPLRPDGETSKLPIARDELEGWIRRFERAEIDLDGDELGARALADLSEVTLLTFVAHGRRGERGASELQWAAAPRGRLAIEDVESLPTVPVCAILAGCRSGQGPARRGDAGSADLGGAFLARGSACVLVASQDVPLGPVMELLGGLHRDVAAGGSPARALCSARWALYELIDDPLALVLMRALGAADVPLPLTTSNDGGRHASLWLLGLAGAAVGTWAWRRRRA